MDNLKLFQIEKSNKEVRDTILANTIKMLTERGLLKKEQIESNIKKLTDTQTQDAVYKVNLDGGKIVSLKIIQKKITAVSKALGISEFLNKFKNNHKIIIVKGITKKAKQYIITNYDNTEIFLEEDLMINLIDHIFIPKHKVLTKEEIEDFYKKYNVKKKNMPKMLSEDPVARYYNMKPGEVCRIIRPSETSGQYATYRLVVKGLLK